MVVLRPLITLLILFISHIPFSASSHHTHHNHHTRSTGAGGTVAESQSQNSQSSQTNHRGISRAQLDNWCTKFGQPLSEFIKTATKYNELHGRFASTTAPTTSSSSPSTAAPHSSRILPLSPQTLLTNLKASYSAFMQENFNALNKLRNTFEQRALDYNIRNSQNQESGGSSSSSPTKPFISSNTLSSIYNFNSTLNPSKLAEHNLIYSPHYQDYVDLQNSSIHLPVSIYPGEPGIKKTLDWTADMDVQFKSITKEHPVVGRMFFGSQEGLTKIYPATPWPHPPPDSANSKSSTYQDLFDPRLRPWYTASANSAKSIVILQDTSGSMTGRRREIAKHVVYTILDTLTPDDFVIVLNYSSSVNNIIECWGKDKFELVNANKKNILRIKWALDVSCNLPECTQGMANLEGGLKKAFEVLRGKQTSNQTQSSSAPLNSHGSSSSWTTTTPSANCNSAIFLITDGSADYYKDVFDTHKDPFNPVRVFTYLIGKEVTDYREVRWMSCATGGFFSHITTLSSVLPAVLSYLPVMSRPLVIYNKHPVSITGPYVSKLTQPHRTSLTKAENNGQDFNFVITISTPVFDLRNNSNNNNAEGRNIANYLGTVGIDINLNELYHLSMPFSLGVGAYGFIVEGKSGRIVMHPKWKPVHGEELLKPAYGDVWFDELETVVPMNDSKVSNNGRSGGIIMQSLTDLLTPSTYSYERNIQTPHISPNYNRITLRPHDIEYTSTISQIPQWSLGVSIPSNSYTFIGEVEMFRVSRDGRGIDVVNWLENSNSNERKWKLNPNWRYCTFIRTKKEFESQEDELIWFLREIQKRGIGGAGTSKSWSWKTNKVGIQSSNEQNEANSNHKKKGNEKSRHHGKKSSNSNGDKNSLNHDEDIYECSKPLIQSLLFDANITEIFTAEKLWKFNKNESSMIEIYGALLVFTSTRSGLTRWIEFEKSKTPKRKSKSHHFNPFTYSPYNPTPPTFPPTLSPYGPDDPQYQRAVDHWYFVENILKNNNIPPNPLTSGGFVFSVPVINEQETGGDLRVTATRAMFVQDPGNPSKSAPVGIVGIQFNHTKLRGKFFEIAGQCLDPHSQFPCTKTCTSEEFDCYVLDDNGYILFGEEDHVTGKFFGLVDGMVMEMLINSDVYKRIPVTDTQAVCKMGDSENDNKAGNAPQHTLTLIKSHILNTFTTFILSLTKVPSAIAQIVEEISEVFKSITTSTPAPEIMSPLDYAILGKKPVKSCAVKYELVTFGSAYNPVEFSYHGILNKCGYNCDGYFNVHSIPHTNLILVVTDGRCRCGHNATDVKGEEVKDHVEIELREDYIVKCPFIHRENMPRRRRKKTSPLPSSDEGREVDEEDDGLGGCFNSNVEEDKISPHACGSGSIMSQVTFWSLMILVTLHMKVKLQD